MEISATVDKKPETRMNKVRNDGMETLSERKVYSYDESLILSTRNLSKIYGRKGGKSGKRTAEKRV